MTFAFSYTKLPLLVAALLVICTTVFLRILYTMPLLSRGYRNPTLKNHPKTTASHMVVVLGSGGHTREMIGLLRRIDPAHYFQRTYIASSGDAHAEVKAREIESNIRRAQGEKDADGMTDELDLKSVPCQGIVDPVNGVWDLKIVPRARAIQQPIYTTPLSALRCLRGCIGALRAACRQSIVAHHGYPDVIMTNGPATAVVVILASYILRLSGMAPTWSMRVIYVESFARVEGLSLSGKIVLGLGLSNVFIVQWEKLAVKLNNKRKRVEYLGILVL
ncbi:glycosyltransferase family 1 protein [Calycina marina]|uniref:UDP-N-acetylglucosamine transferase subunit ALG14 n=1 Tax=Calycina marina TaxID=1763456 RepID=A0A9P7YWE5_9HELO|nr:glycosyltransferase family 1 protein [Calycina marina]